ncbi:MAG TPA: glycoside hydrolase family 25 protein [Chthoniobacterales bacterium]|nr:glycoside hydrolase family 25 protein [Chthoniobacterales bacterium]
MINTIIDIYHGNSINFEECREGGIVAIIHKATQGATMRDSKYHQRRDRAKELGFRWGAYHFSTGGSVSDQVENFLTYARPEDDDLISLDWEPSDGPDMTLDQARHFVQMVKDETGRWPVIYGGHVLRESIGHNPDSILSNCPLWYARYASSPIGIPTQVWPTYTLWQYTDGEVGPPPRETPGVSGADRNIFQGTTQQLKDLWPFTRREEGGIIGAGFDHILNPPQAEKKPRSPKRREGD